MSFFGVRTWRVLARGSAQAAIAGPLVLVAVLAAGGLSLAAGRISAGELFAAGRYAVLGAGLGSLTGVLGALARSRAARARIGEILALPPMGFGIASTSDGPGRLEFRGVWVDGLLHGIDLSLPPRVVDSALRGAVAGRPDDGAVARLTRQVEVVRDSYAGLLLVTRGFVVSVTGATVGLLSLSPVIVALIAPPFLLGLLGFLASLGLAARRHRDAALAEEAVAASATTVLSGARDAIACGATDYASNRAGRAIDDQAAAERALAGVAALRTLCFAVGGWLPVLILLGAAPLLDVSAGTVLGGLTYVLSGLQAALLKLMSGIGGSGMRYVITLGRLLAPPPSLPPRTPAKGARLVARNVSFAYGTHSEPIISGLDLIVADGDHLAIIGPSGIGKSTLARVLCGLLPPTGGEVEVGEAVLIPQEAYVFTGTLRENLTYLCPGADPAGALLALGAGHLIAGLDAEVTPGRLPAGQRQLIALARSYVSLAPIAVLDEATCHLDPAAEAVVERAFAARPGALVVIAHRLGSALRARRILVLDGQSATLGDHESLLERSELYRKLISSLSPVPAGSPRSLSGSRSWSGCGTGGCGPSRC